MGDKSYRIALRFRTNYKPYSVTLTDAQREYYTGTETPKWYSSDIVLDDHAKGIESAQRVWMNNPLRYSDETFYQSGMDTLPNGKTYTVLQIVRIAAVVGNPAGVVLADVRIRICQSPSHSALVNGSRDAGHGAVDGTVSAG